MTFDEYKKNALGIDGKIHYVYWITDKEDGKHYVGKHRSDNLSNLIEDFFKYGTSSERRPLIIKYKAERYVLTILKKFDSAAESSLYEAYIHTKLNVAFNSDFWNKVQVDIPNGLKFGQTNKKVPVIELSTGKRTAVTKEEYQKNKQNYKHIHCGMTTCYDKEIGKNVRISSEEYHSNLERYVAIQTGKIPRFDKILGRNVQVSLEDFELDPDRYAPMEHDGRQNIVVINSEGFTERIPREEYHNNKGKYKHPSAGRTNAIILETGKTINLNLKEFRKLKKEGKVVGQAHFSKMDKVLDVETQKIIKVSKEERARNPERYKYINSREAKDFLGRNHSKPKNFYKVYDLKDSSFKTIPKEEYYKHKERYLCSTTKTYREILKSKENK